MSESNDYLSDKAANYKLIADIKAWWAKRGYQVNCWIEKIQSPVSGHTTFIVRTNITQDVKNAERGYVV